MTLGAGHRAPGNHERSGTVHLWRRIHRYQELSGQNEGRVANGNFEFYAMDSYKATARLTLTAGMRGSWNTNVVNNQSLFARPAGSFSICRTTMHSRSTRRF